MIFEELKRKRRAEDDRFEGGTNVLRFLKDFKMGVESVHGVTAQDKYDELVLWTKGKAQVLVKSFRDFDDVSFALEESKKKLADFFGSRPRTSTEIFQKVLEGKQIGTNDLEAMQSL